MIGPMLRELSLARGHAKLAVLKKANSGVKQIIEYTYNPDYVYHLKPGHVEVHELFDRTTVLHSEEWLFLDKLLKKQLSGNAARDALTELTEEHGPLLKLILARDLKCGVAATSINKAIPGLIPQFKVQLAKEVPFHKVKFPCYAQLKYDGVRIVTTIKEGKVRFRTRNGKEVKLPKLAKLLDFIKPDLMLDGELILRGGKMADRTSVSGMVNSAMHGGRILEEKLEYVIFDTMLLWKFENLIATDIYSTRYTTAKSLVNLIENSMVTIASNQLVNSPKEVEDLAKNLYTDGMEGLVLKHPTHKYTFKRSKEWVKVKETKSADLRVLRALEGEGKYQGMVGSLLCYGKVEGRVVTVAVGSGLSDSQRETSLDRYDDLIVEVKYNSVIKDSKTGKWSLFLPRFVCIRIDK